MQNIIDILPNAIRLETYVKGNAVDLSVTPVDSFAFGRENAPLALETHDEVPCFFLHEEGYFGAIKVSFQEAIDGKIVNLLGEALKENGLDGERLHVIMGPCLTFPHCPVEPEVFDEVTKKYLPACKVTSGTHYIDVPLICLLQFRALGAKMENIRIGDYDTYENASLLYSQKRGEENENVTLATLL